MNTENLPIIDLPYLPFSIGLGLGVTEVEVLGALYIRAVSTLSITLVSISGIEYFYHRNYLNPEECKLLDSVVSCCKPDDITTVNLLLRMLADNIRNQS